MADPFDPLASPKSTQPSPPSQLPPVSAADMASSKTAPFNDLANVPDHIQQTLELEEGLLYVPVTQTDSGATSEPSSRKVPEILAPAGGREQFFAALNAGADAVYLGLKAFNARARAENFTLEDLQSLVPLAHQYGMKVLVTVNVLIKEAELPDLIQTLGNLEALEVDAIIVQDVAVARLTRHHFPRLRLHASTQLAVHNLAGVLEAYHQGFKRVVLARELTAKDLRQLRQAVPPGGIEVEAFCHGSLCYSYSGLCFFSGAGDARSGNRGECAYTCRQPYRIVNEPGHGFLFSMKDLDTSHTLELLVDAGVDTLKIEGRKKDAQYVATVVRLYRHQLDQLFGRPTLRPEAPPEAHTLYAPVRAHSPQPSSALQTDLRLSFHRDVTGFFVQGRYHENVIDLDNPTHLGLEVGRVDRIQGRTLRLHSKRPLERFDGLRILPSRRAFHARPQHGETLTGSSAELWEKYQNEVISFSLREMKHRGIRVPTAPADAVVELQLPDDVPLPRVGDVVYQWRSADLKRRVEALSQPPREAKLRPWQSLEVRVQLQTLPPAAPPDLSGKTRLRLDASTYKHEQLLTRDFLDVDVERPRGKATLVDDLHQLLSTFGDDGFRATSLSVEGDAHFFVPRSQLKALKAAISASLTEAYGRALQQHIQAAQQEVTSSGLTLSRQISELRMSPASPVPAQARLSRFQLKIDRLEYLPWIERFLQQNPAFTLSELIFEPKRMFVYEPRPESLIQTLSDFSSRTGVKLRMAFPMVLRTWDEAPTRKWLQAFIFAGHRALELSNLGALSLLEAWGLNRGEGERLELASDFTLYALNSVASHFWQEQGFTRLALSIEDDLDNLRQHLNHWPTPTGEAPQSPSETISSPMPLLAQAIVYKDTPLFIAEACSLTALHNGCPTSKVCGYRTLEIENQQGERFFVAHEQCKSIVYAHRAYSLLAHQTTLRQLGIEDFRIDFLTRPYEEAGLVRVLQAALGEKELPDTHTANFLGRLL